MLKLEELIEKKATIAQIKIIYFHIRLLLIAQLYRLNVLILFLL